MSHFSATVQLVHFDSSQYKSFSRALQAGAVHTPSKRVVAWTIESNDSSELQDIASMYRDFCSDKKTFGFVTYQDAFFQLDELDNMLSYLDMAFSTAA
ncbi:MULTISPECIES: hypothetical protein [Vibrio]|uniref:Uncharacterized protein n=1 Tax=Vibrio tasmaniensis TaxID=212663 RepID=A0A2N7NN85_9VIBR|nr:hypothetical protein [Vibrio tasmaniensis]PMO89884.1 hypothetical protein BCT01_00965 [Vibrio tasmaniensis]PMP17750.1 hypothetical protein BCS92_04920 [Vibrio tasmaniensis]TKG27989.1 hypothetical protein FC057_22640 [Vibrio tasmaniensis]TKG41646.1 hypothetical protein FC063_07230 [Vibrio tasmaniensis]TKG44890.1 hypothetical protein FC061_20365 [Vibrio tasmaniensis]